ncbi:class I SAM-dependent methyltransferase [Viridibacterium curvum]|uniref:Methyltransferase domain-containing protein n=1 Tax=Viridibacterium curvum TaxID=1101404 RepID=A0ABP9R1F6_9RHOO
MSIPGFQDWLASPRGQYLLAWEQRQCDNIVADIFGYNAVQIGLPGTDYLRANRMPSRFHCCDGSLGDVLCDAEELPFASQSLDLLVLPHVLEFAAHPHQLLREAERVLVPEGSLVLTGFNPYSLWGVRRAFSGNLGPIPWQGQYLAVHRLKDWLTLLSFEAHTSNFGCYAPPVSSDVWLRRWSFMEFAGSRWWPFAGGAYLIHAVKKVRGMRLIVPSWRRAPRSKKAMAPVPQRVQRGVSSAPDSPPKRLPDAS